MEVKIKIPNNCCECRFCSELSDGGYRYCTNKNRDKKNLNQLYEPDYYIQTNCPLIN